MDSFAYNQQAWDRQVELGDRWTVPVDAETVARARAGDFAILLTPNRTVPRDWFPASLAGIKVLGLACGGGQQCPLLAAAGAEVTVFDASDKQLGQDRLVAEREGLDMRFVQGDMRDLGALADESFDLIFHPVSNMFVPDVLPVWREAARVLKTGGELLAGFVNPLYFLFDDDALGRDEYVVRYRIPYADHEQLDSAALDAMMAQDEPLCFGHSLTDQLGGQMEAGLAVVAMFEDRWNDKPIDDRIATFMATRARKL